MNTPMKRAVPARARNHCRRCFNVRLLGRALALGFAEFQVGDPAAPILCQDEKRTFVCMPLDKEGAREAWLRAIEKDGLTWTQVSDLKFWNNAVARQYDINSIPANLLIGPDGKIVAKNLHEGELAKKLAELLN